MSYLDTTKQRINSELLRLKRTVCQLNSETATDTTIPGKQFLFSREATPSKTMDTSHCQETSIPWIKISSKRGRSPQEESTREANYQLERKNPTTDEEQENDISENTKMVDW
jgi:hypothetical protein